MKYQKFRPCEQLQQFIECYFIWESSNALSEELIVESPPSGFCSIVFNSGDQYFLQNKKYKQLPVPPQFIAGQSIYSYRLFLKGIISIVGIVFKPTGLSALFNLPTYEYTEERIPLSSVFKKSFLDPYIEKIRFEADGNQKVKLLEEFVLIHYNANKPRPDYIDYAANLIVEKNGLINISDLMKDVFMSKRSFERNFFKKVGLSPKFYARLRRMSFLTNLIAGKKKIDWVDIFFKCEFYDQSHFIKDFIEFTGRTPQQYLKENAELANIIEKPKTHIIQY